MGVVDTFAQAQLQKFVIYYQKNFKYVVVRIDEW